MMAMTVRLIQCSYCYRAVHISGINRIHFHGTFMCKIATKFVCHVRKSAELSGAVPRPKDLIPTFAP